MNVFRKCLVVCVLLLMVKMIAPEAYAQASITIGRGQNKRVTKLHDLKIESELYGSVLVQKYELSFFNDGRGWAEGELNCYLPEGSRVVDYAMTVGGKRRDGVVVPAKLAVDAYEDIVRRRTDPGLLEIDDVNHQFRMRVFPIESNQEKRVWITTVRLLNDDTVDLGLEHLGAAKTVFSSVSVFSKEAPVLLSPEGWKFVKAGDHWKASIVTENQKLPSCKLGVKVKQRVFRYDDKKTKASYYASVYPEMKQQRKDFNGLTQLWWDGTTEPTFEVLNALSNWFKWKQSGEIELTVFRDEIIKSGTFTIIDGKCDALLQKLQKVQPYGMARPSLLDWKGKHAGVVIVSDGVYAEGLKGVPEKVPYPLFSIVAGDGRKTFLTGLSYLSQNPLLPSSLHDLSASSYQSHNVQTGFSYDEVNLPASQNKVAYWLWAMNTAKLYRAREYNHDVVAKFHTKHSVADGNFSWIVLESLQQHIRYKIPPAESEVEMLAAWKARQNDSKHDKFIHLEHLAKLWKKRCDSHFQEAPTYKQNAQRYLNSNAEMMLNLPTQVLKLKPSEKAFYQNSKTALDTLKAESDIYHFLANFQEKHIELTKKIKVMSIVVTGQVGRPGPTVLPLGTSIYDVVMKAKPNTFAALRRVELIRNGRIYKYSLKNKAHQKLRIYPNDRINVPQQNMFGNGGGKPGQRVPFKTYREKGDPELPAIQSKRAKLVWDVEKTYLNKLSNKQGLTKLAWYQRYFKLRIKFGWKADFYEDLICLLEEEKQKDFARMVACDLAELEPDNNEVLRRAARSLHRLGELELAQSLYQRLVTLEPDSDVAYYDLARLYESKSEHQLAAQNFWKACLLIPIYNAEGRCIVYLEDLNACIHKGKLDPSRLGVPAELIRHIAMDMRVVLRWDATQCNADLLVEQPMLGIGTGFIYPVESVNKWKWSKNVSRGLGPESCTVREIDPGNYIIKAKFKGDWVHESKSTATMTVEVIKNFGQKNETRETVTRRVAETKTVKMIHLDRAPQPHIK